MSEPHIIDRSAQQTHAWLAELAAELGSDDRNAAYRALRAVLHTLRDRLTVEEAAQLAAQLPTMIRGVYYEGWKPSRVPVPYHDVDSFLAHVREEGVLAGETEASVAVAAVARLLRHHVSAGELDDVLAMLPEGLRPLLAEPA